MGKRSQNVKDRSSEYAELVIGRAQDESVAGALRMTGLDKQGGRGMGRELWHGGRPSAIPPGDSGEERCRSRRSVWEW